MKIASFNVENLFDRAKAFNDDSAEAKKALALGQSLTLFLNTLFSAKQIS